MTKWVYGFGNGGAEGRAEMRTARRQGREPGRDVQSRITGAARGSRLQQKPAPISIHTTTPILQSSAPPSTTALVRMGEVAGGLLGDHKRPLLVSVRSGARVSMPGMMDTVLNLGLNTATVEGLANATGDARFAFDRYRRFIQMYAKVVLGIKHHHFLRHLAHRRQ